MKKIFYIGMLLFLLSGCKTNEPDHSMIGPLPAMEIDSLHVAGKNVTVTVSYMISTPCWDYYKTESSNDGKVFTSKVFGKYDGEICEQIVTTLRHTLKIHFSTAGTKELRFWQNDSTYLDTIITVE